MLLKNGRIYLRGQIHEGSLLISNGDIKRLFLNEKDDSFNDVNDDIIDCEKRLILPGIIDIHAHLRDLEQSEKETFITGTQAAVFSGITTVFNMPNTKPPSINAEQCNMWMQKAKGQIFVDVGFISGLPHGLDNKEIEKIIDLGIIGFKIYPHNPLNKMDWTNKENIYSLFSISSQYQKVIFIHPEWPSANIKTESLRANEDILNFHDRMKPIESEKRYIELISNLYLKYIEEKKLRIDDYPIIHFCHISNELSFTFLDELITLNPEIKISFEVSPHHILLSKNLELRNPKFGKVDPPLREEKHRKFLLDKLNEGKIPIIASDHAPHTIIEKSKEFDKIPSGFPEFETYPLLLLDKALKRELSLESLIKAMCENPAKKFNLRNKGFIEEGYQADIIIVDIGKDYLIQSKNFKSKAKFSPYENFKTSIKIWKVFLNGKEIDPKNPIPMGKIINISS